MCWSLFKYLVFGTTKYKTFGPFYNNDGEGFELEFSTSITSTNPYYSDYETEKEIEARKKSEVLARKEQALRIEEEKRARELNELLQDMYGKDILHDSEEF